LQWHDINDPGFFTKKDMTAAGVPQTMVASDVAPAEKKEPEVTLKNACWKEGNEGFTFNKKCFLEVKGTYLKKTIQTRVTGNLVVVFNNEEEDLRHKVEGHLDDACVALLEVPLWYGEKYHAALQNDKAAACSYKVKNIKHSNGTNQIESESLDMPNQAGTIVRFRLDMDPGNPDTQNDSFRLFSTDTQKTYDKKLTIADDKIPGDKFLDLEFGGLDSNLKYTLEIDTGDGGAPMAFFENLSIQEMLGL
jgi:hypothetical protein